MSEKQVGGVPTGLIKKDAPVVPKAAVAPVSGYKISLKKAKSYRMPGNDITYFKGAPFITDDEAAVDSFRKNGHFVITKL